MLKKGKKGEKKDCPGEQPFNQQKKNQCLYNPIQENMYIIDEARNPNYQLHLYLYHKKATASSASANFFTISLFFNGRCASQILS